jgi:hypothetical protein
MRRGREDGKGQRRSRFINIEGVLSVREEPEIPWLVRRVRLLDLLMDASGQRLAVGDTPAVEPQIRRVAQTTRERSTPHRRNVDWQALEVAPE